MLEFDVAEMHIIVWRSISVFLLISFLILWYFYDIESKVNSPEYNTEKYLVELRTILFFNFGIMFLAALANIVSGFKLFESDFSEIIERNLVSAISLFMFVYIAEFLARWFLIRRTKRTRLYLVILLYIVGFSILKSYFDYYKFGLNSFTSFITFASFVLSIYIIWYSAGKTNWISSLNRKKKWGLFIVSFFNIMSTIIILITINSENNFYTIVTGDFFIPLPALIEAISLFNLVYNLRILVAAIAALPTSGMMERKNTELQSIAFLNRYVAESIDKDFNYLIKTVTNLAVKTVNAAGAWVEIYDNSKSGYFIETNVNIPEELIIKTHSIKNSINLFKSFEKTYLVKSIPEDDAFYFINEIIPIAKSMIISPIIKRDKRIGSMVIIDSDEYGFESEDVYVQNTFVDNLKIALDNAELVKESFEKEKYKNELLLAHDMQNKLLPQDLPLIRNFTIGAFSIPAMEVGGDYYDVVKLASGKICILIGDVSGKGITAAFYMAQLKGTVLALAWESDSGKSLLKKINKVLYKNMDKKTYITISAITIEDDKGKISFCRAGHMPLILKRNSKIELVKNRGLGVGLVNSDIFDTILEEEMIQLQNGETCILFTDGINELRNDKNKEFGLDKLETILLENNISKANDYIEIIKKELEDFSKNTFKFDDMTLLVLSYLENETF